MKPRSGAVHTMETRMAHWSLGISTLAHNQRPDPAEVGSIFHPGENAGRSSEVILILATDTVSRNAYNFNVHGKRRVKE